MLTIFYGASGVGKNYIGKMYANKYNCYFYDADTDLTKQMKQYIRQKKSFTQKIRDDFFTLIAKQIKSYLITHKHVVVTQAFSQEVNRQQIKTYFPSAVFCCITTTPNIQIQNIRQRNNEIDEEYLIELNKIQQPPSIGDFVLHNTRNNQNIDEQLLKFQNFYIKKNKSI